MTTQKSTVSEHLLDTDHRCKNINENLTILNFENRGEKIKLQKKIQYLDALFNMSKETKQSCNKKCALSHSVFGLSVCVFFFSNPN